MTALRAPRRLALTLLASLLAVPTLAEGQVVSGQTIAGDWVRFDSNNDPNDLMRITISGTGAVLTSVPAPAAPHWKVGDVLWQGITSAGKLRVRGSDGNYYDADMTLNGPDEIHLTIHLRTAGDDQTWRRAGPDISGDWVRVAPPGTPGAGTRIQVQGTDASVRYITATAPQVLRIGSRIWQTIGASGGLQVLGDDNRHHAATWTLVAPDRIHVDAPAIAGGAGQIWVRPGSVAAAQTTLQTPQVTPNPSGANPTPLTPLPAPPTTPAMPPVPPATPSACLATSMPHDATGLNWGWGVTSPTGLGPLAVSTGVALHMANGIPNGTGDAPLEIDRFRHAGFQDGFAYVWARRSRRFPWEEHRDLTAAQLDQQNQTARAAGMRLADVVAYDTPSGVRYAGVWGRNIEGIDWRLEYDQTSQEFGQTFQTLYGSGYRLVDIEIYSGGGGLRYAGVWWASCDNSNWGELRGLTRQAYQDSVDALGARGYRVIDFESYRTSAGQRYAAIWQGVPPGRDWAVRSDRDFNWFLNYHHRYTDLGMRLIDFEAYDTPNGIRYAGVWAENDARYDFALRPLLEDTVATYQQRHSVPGISVAVIRNDEVIFQGGFGWADQAAEKWAWSGTVYPTASIAKVVGATLAARFEQQGLIDLSKPTSDYLDYIDDVLHTHDVDELLSKSGCMYHYPEGPEPDDTQVYAYRRPAVEQMMDAPLLTRCTPGNQYHYSTHGFTYVGAVLEEVLDGTIYDIVSDELTVPFQLWSLKPMAWESFGTGPYAGQGTWPYELAQGYWWVRPTTPGAAGTSDPRDYENMAWKVLGGGLESSALDLARFGALTRNGTLVSTTTRDTRLWTPVSPSATTEWSDGSNAPSVGLAWVLRTRTGGRNVAEHSGDTSGGLGGGAPTLRIYRDPVDAGLVIAVMNNQQNSSSVLNNATPPVLGGGQPVETLANWIANVIFSNLPP